MLGSVEACLYGLNLKIVGDCSYIHIYTWLFLCWKVFIERKKIVKISGILLNCFKDHLLTLLGIVHNWHSPSIIIIIIIIIIIVPRGSRGLCWWRCKGEEWWPWESGSGFGVLWVVGKEKGKKKREKEGKGMKKKERKKWGVDRVVVAVVGSRKEEESEGGWVWEEINKIKKNGRKKEKCGGCRDEREKGGSKKGVVGFLLPFGGVQYDIWYIPLL